GLSAVSVKYRALGRVEAVLPERLGLATLAERLKAAAADGSAEKVPKEFLDVDWAAEVKRGDAERGRKLFGADGLGCVKCHGILPGRAGGGGPSLAEAGKRFTVPHLVESVLLPGKQVAPVFRSTSLTLKDGRVRAGLVVEEDDAKLVLLLPDATRETVAKERIDERTLLGTSPTPAAGW